MLCARVVFLYNGKESKEYFYELDGHVAEGLSIGEWVVVESAKSKYGLGLYKGWAEVTDTDTIAIVTKAVVCGTELIEEQEEPEEEPDVLSMFDLEDI